MSRSGMSPYIICWGALAAWLAPGGAWLSWGEGVLLQFLKSSPQGSAMPPGEKPGPKSSPTLCVLWGEWGVPWRGKSGAILG